MERGGKNDRQQGSDQTKSAFKRECQVLAPHGGLPKTSRGLVIHDELITP